MVAVGLDDILALRTVEHRVEPHALSTDKSVGRPQRSLHVVEAADCVDVQPLDEDDSSSIADGCIAGERVRQAAGAKRSRDEAGMAAPTCVPFYGAECSAADIAILPT